jgi:hypothetical protein
MKTNYVWQQWMIAAGYAALLVGALDPMEGSLIILPGAALVALGTYLDKEERPRLRPRLAAFILIAFGVGSLWGLSQQGGFGGDSGRSLWWGTPILLYLAGWSWATWAQGTPRWVTWVGTLVGLFYLAIPLLAMRAGRTQFLSALVVVAVTGLVTVVGCVRRLWLNAHPPAAASPTGAQATTA